MRPTPRAARPPRVAVIADDLTGANDTGVQFARRGARTLVPLDWRDLSALGDADVLVLNTASRALSPQAAAQRVRAAARALKRAKVEIVYKKIDSTARGNIGVELDALLDVFPAPVTVLTPAFPPAGRAVRDGCLLVHGTPVHQTAIGADPVTPVRESHLPTLLREQMRRPVHLLPLARLRGSPAGLRQAVAGWHAAAPGVVVADAETTGDLARLARLILGHRFSVCAGSAGLGLALSGRLRWPRPRSRRPHGVAAPALLVVGSPNPVSRDQVAQLGRQGARVVAAAVPAVLAGSASRRRERERVAHDVLEALAAGTDAVLTLGDRPGRRPAPSASAALSAFLGRAAAHVMRERRPSGLVLCGGDIAIAVSRALHAGGFELADEVEAGVPWGRLRGGDFDDLPVVTKAGGFGRPDTFVAAAAFLRGPVSPRRPPAP